MKLSSKLAIAPPTNFLNLIIHHSKSISPYALGSILFIIVYFRMCTNESDITGNTYFEQGNYKIALKHYNEYLNLQPHDINTLYNRGRCFDELGYPEKAAKDYEEVLDRDPNNVKALVSLSQYYYNKKDFNVTINLCTNATQIDKENYLAHYYKARACHKIGDVPDAVESYNAVIDLNPEFGFAYFQRSSLLISIGLKPFGCYDLAVADSLNVLGAHEAFIKYCR